MRFGFLTVFRYSTLSLGLWALVEFFDSGTEIYPFCTRTTKNVEPILRTQSVLDGSKVLPCALSVHDWWSMVVSHSVMLIIEKWHSPTVWKISKLTPPPRRTCLEGGYQGWRQWNWREGEFELKPRSKLNSWEALMNFIMHTLIWKPLKNFNAITV